MNLQRLARRLALLAIILVTAWVFAPKPDHPAGTPITPPGARTPAPPTDTPPTPAPPAGQYAASRTIAAPTSPVPPPPPAVSPAAPASASLPATAVSPDAAAAIAVDGIRRMLRDYRTLTGENPVGTNAEIMRALMGDNPRQATLGPPEGQSLNDQGELVDRWGTPVFFHQLSKTLMEIRSAGPDRTLWTEDDIVAR